MKKTSLALIVVLVLLPSAVLAAVTVTNKTLTTIGHKHALWADIAFDSSYDALGEGFDYTSYGFTSVDSVLIYDKAGYSFEYDYTNKKVKAFQEAPPIVYDEKHTAVAHVITLDYPAAWIISVSDGTNGKQMIANADNCASGEVKLYSLMADNVRTQLSTVNATDTLFVTYATQSWKELYDLLVQEEAVTLTTGSNNTTYSMMAFGYCTSYSSGTTSFTTCKPIDNADTPTSSEVGINQNASEAGSLTVSSDHDGSVGYVTYLKYPATGSWLYSRIAADEDPTTGAEPNGYSHTFDYPCLMWGISGYALVNGGTTQLLCAEHIGPAANEVHANWGYRGLFPTGVAPSAGFVLAGPTNVTVTSGTYLKGHPWEIHGLVPLEVKNGTDLSGLTGIKIQIIGN